jgi:glucose-6-phosphate isomerase
MIWFMVDHLQTRSIAYPEYSHPQVLFVLDRLQKMAERGYHLPTLFEKDPQRSQKYTCHLQQPHNSIALDYSKNLIDDESIELFNHLWDMIKIQEKTEALLAGEIVNPTENRPAMHIALRSQHDSTPRAIKQQIKDDDAKMFELINKLQQGDYTDIIHIGIGGSDLGVRMLHHALSVAKNFSGILYKVHFVANLDRSELNQCLQQINPKKTLVIVCSKTFSTLETIENLKAIQNDSAIPNDQIIAITTDIERAKSYDLTHILHFADWVGGRFSIWSAVGFLIALVHGIETFQALRRGAALADWHVTHAKGMKNMAWVLAILGIYYRNGHHIPEHCIAPYGFGLKHFANYLQQLEMESNGKSISTDGVLLSYPTAPVVFGDVGSSCQHSYFQLLHQSRNWMCVDFIYYQQACHQQLNAHQKLLAQCQAQSLALMHGQNHTAIYQTVNTQNHSNQQIENLERLAPTYHAGNRPSNTLILPELNAHYLGQLMAIYEHKVFYQSQVWRINPFDQYGVELGKKIAQELCQPVKQNDLSSGISTQSKALSQTDLV